MRLDALDRGHHLLADLCVLPAQLAGDDAMAPSPGTGGPSAGQAGACRNCGP